MMATFKHAVLCHVSLREQVSVHNLRYNYV